MTPQQRANQVLADIKNKNKPAAIQNLERLLDDKAQLGELWGALTRLAISIGEINLSLRCAKLYLATDPTNLQKNIQVGSIYAESGRFNDALALLNPLAEKVESVSLNHLLGTIYSQVGDNKNAQQHCRKALIQNPMLGITWLTLSALKTFSVDDKELETLRAMESRVSGSDPQNDIPYWYAFGKALLDIGDIEAAYEKFEKGAKLMHSTSQFDERQNKSVIEHIIQNQTKDYFDSLPKVNKDQGKGLIFVVGLPRSGTTLLQQFLTCHPEITAGGETNSLAIAIANIGQTNINALGENSDALNVLNSIAQEYIQLMEQRFSDKGMLLDKSFNINQHLGLVAHIFPAAKIIHIERSKPETAWSCFRTFFSQGLPWTFNIDDIQKYFETDTTLLKHWYSFLSDRIIRLDYENLVTEPKETLTKVCIGLDIDYDYAFTAFNENTHPVQTASVGQVRGPLSRKSISMPESIRDKFSQF